MPMEYFPAFESLKEFGNYEPVLNKYKLKYLEQTFNLKSLVTLKEQAYVNDDMVTHFIRWVLKNYIPDDTLFMQTSLLTSYMGSKLIPLQVLIDRVPNVASATQEFPRFSFGSVRHFYTFRHKVKKISSYNKIMLCYCDDMHWSLYVVYPQQKTVEEYNSAGTNMNALWAVYSIGTEMNVINSKSQSKMKNGSYYICVQTYPNKVTLIVVDF